MINKALERKIKKNLYGQPQSAQAIFPAGLGAVSLAECRAILADPWLPTQFKSEVSLLKNEIRLDNIHLFQMMELLLRASSLTDLRLIIFAGKVAGKKMFDKKCRAIPWECYVNPALSLKIKVDSIASHAFHETGLKIILSDILAEQAIKTISGDATEEYTTLYAHLDHDYLTLSISLAGEVLYKRGYRGVLSASAPLREDIAACCLQKGLTFARQCDPNYFPDTVWVPFSGTGTFAFEYVQQHFHCVPGLMGREYAMQKMAFFRQASFDFLLKKARAESQWEKKEQPLHLFCLDISQTANAALANNQRLFVECIERNGFAFPKEIFATEPAAHDFFAIDDKRWLQGNHAFLPLNPPYGIRLGKQIDSVAFYKKIALKINDLTRQKKKRLAGFILCPNQETWSAFRHALVYEHEETYHFTQGGMDIRVCQFFV